jgi:hypothetical protein
MGGGQGRGRNLTKVSWLYSVVHQFQLMLRFLPCLLAVIVAEGATGRDLSSPSSGVVSRQTRVSSDGSGMVSSPATVGLESHHRRRITLQSKCLSPCKVLGPGCNFYFSRALGHDKLLLFLIYKASLVPFGPFTLPSLRKIMSIGFFRGMSIGFGRYFYYLPNGSSSWVRRVYPCSG